MLGTTQSRLQRDIDQRNIEALSTEIARRVIAARAEQVEPSPYYKFFKDFTGFFALNLLANIWSAFIGVITLNEYDLKFDAESAVKAAAMGALVTGCVVALAYAYKNRPKAQENTESRTAVNSVGRSYFWTSCAYTSGYLGRKMLNSSSNMTPLKCGIASAVGAGFIAAGMEMGEYISQQLK